MKKAFAPWCLFLLLISCGRQPVQQSGVSTPPNIVNAIEIRGNRRVSSETLRANIHSETGAPLNEATVKADVARIRSLNDIDEVIVSDQTNSSGVRALIFTVREKPPDK